MRSDCIQFVLQCSNNDDETAPDGIKNWKVFPELKKNIDVKKICAIILCSAIKIPEQSYYAQYKAGGEVRCETMSNVIVKENETLDSALRRFKRNCAKAGIQQEIRKREHYEKPSVRRKKKSEAARKRKYN